MLLYIILYLGITNLIVKNNGTAILLFEPKVDAYKNK